MKRLMHAAVLMLALPSLALGMGGGVPPCADVSNRVGRLVHAQVMAADGVPAALRTLSDSVAVRIAADGRVTFVHAGYMGREARRRMRERPKDARADAVRDSLVQPSAAQRAAATVLHAAARRIRVADSLRREIAAACGQRSVFAVLGESRQNQGGVCAPDAAQARRENMPACFPADVETVYLAVTDDAGATWRITHQFRWHEYPAAVPPAVPRRRS